jgi:hypothetical protein
MPVCGICRTTFHACSNCGLNRSYEYEYCSPKCWKESSEYKGYEVKFKALYSTINQAQKKMLLSMITEMSDDYIGEVEEWKEELEKKDA